MPVKIVRRNVDITDYGNLKYEDDDSFFGRVNMLVDGGWSVVSVLEEREKGRQVDPVFVLRQKVQKEVTAALSVPLEEVEKYVAEGWTVEQLYAKTATVIKTAQKTNGLENLAEAEETVEA